MQKRELLSCLCTRHIERTPEGTVWVLGDVLVRDRRIFFIAIYVGSGCTEWQLIVTTEVSKIDKFTIDLKKIVSDPGLLWNVVIFYRSSCVWACGLPLKSPCHRWTSRLCPSPAWCPPLPKTYLARFYGRDSFYTTVSSCFGPSKFPGNFGRLRGRGRGKVRSPCGLGTVHPQLEIRENIWSDFKLLLVWEWLVDYKGRSDSFSNPQLMDGSFESSWSKGGFWRMTRGNFDVNCNFLITPVQKRFIASRW